MGAFIKSFLLEDPRRLMGAQGVQLFLAAFGKHPGWDDHIEDIGLDTESLVAAKQNLYVNGIGRQIDSAAWDKLGEAEALAAFRHNFLWYRSGQFLLGRLWSSSDGKGRTRYPMVVCCHCVELPLGATARKVLPLLAQLEIACKRVKTAPEVQSVLAQSLNQLRVAICDLGSEPQEAAPLADSERKVLDSLAGGPREEGLLRVMYQVQTHMSAFAPGRFSLKADDASLRPQQIRVPATPENPVDSLLVWSRILDSSLDPASPRLFLIPDGEPWLDFIVGEPSEQEFFGLRATPKAVPLASEVPYNLDPAFRERIRKFLADFRAGKISPPQSPGSTLRQSTTAFTRRWFKGGKKWFGAASLVVAAAGALAWWAFNSARDKDADAAGRGVPAEPPPLSAASIPSPPPVAADVSPGPTTSAPVAVVPAPEPKPIPQPPPIVVPVVPKPATQEIAQASPPIAVEKKTAPPPQPVVVAAAPAAPAGRGVPAEPPPARTQAREPPPNKNLTSSIGMELVWLTNGFWAGRYEVTQDEYSRVMGSNPSKFKGARLPVENVSWHEALDFCKKLTVLDRDAGAIAANAHYTLPTEKQWEAFLGKAKFRNAVTSQASERKSTEPVGGSGTNQFGLFDVLGNVWEWCLEEAATKTLKGAAYNSTRTQDGILLTETTALKLAPRTKLPHTGFRCVLIPSE